MLSSIVVCKPPDGPQICSEIVASLVSVPVISVVGSDDGFCPVLKLRRHDLALIKTGAGLKEKVREQAAPKAVFKGGQVPGRRSFCSRCLTFPETLK